MCLCLFKVYISKSFSLRAYTVLVIIICCHLAYEFIVSVMKICISHVLLRLYNANMNNACYIYKARRGFVRINYLKLSSFPLLPPFPLHHNYTLFIILGTLSNRTYVRQNIITFICVCMITGFLWAHSTILFQELSYFLFKYSLIDYQIYIVSTFYFATHDFVFRRFLFSVVIFSLWRVWKIQASQYLK